MVLNASAKVELNDLNCLEKMLEDHICNSDVAEAIAEEAEARRNEEAQGRRQQQEEEREAQWVAQGIGQLSLA